MHATCDDPRQLSHPAPMSTPPLSSSASCLVSQAPMRSAPEIGNVHNAFNSTHNPDLEQQASTKVVPEAPTGHGADILNRIENVPYVSSVSSMQGAKQSTDESEIKNVQGQHIQSSKPIDAANNDVIIKRAYEVSSPKRCTFSKTCYGETLERCDESRPSYPARSCLHAEADICQVAFSELRVANLTPPAGCTIPDAQTRTLFAEESPVCRLTQTNEHEIYTPSSVFVPANDKLIAVSTSVHDDSTAFAKHENTDKPKTAGVNDSLNGNDSPLPNANDMSKLKRPERFSSKRTGNLNTSVLLHAQDPGKTITSFMRNSVTQFKTASASNNLASKVKSPKGDSCSVVRKHHKKMKEKKVSKELTQACWTSEEVQQLILVRKNEALSWNDIAKHFPKRSMNCVRRRYCRLAATAKADERKRRKYNSYIPSILTSEPENRYATADEENADLASNENAKTLGLRSANIKVKVFNSLQRDARPDQSIEGAERNLQPDSQRMHVQSKECYIVSWEIAVQFYSCSCNEYT
jgi:Myb-like DNA-binding domain